ncbi:MAG: hypothetical protein EHM28_12935, partial [Spirochaetaceae bacterium]
MKDFYFKIKALSQDVFSQKPHALGFTDCDCRVFDGQGIFCPHVNDAAIRSH